jgi:hypothetical protein
LGDGEAGEPYEPWPPWDGGVAGGAGCLLKAASAEVELDEEGLFCCSSMESLSTAAANVSVAA